MSKDKTKVLLKKMKEDRPWYMEHFLKIRDKNANLIPFKINDAQTLFENEIQKCEKEGRMKRFIILKARQMGFSTFTEGLESWCNNEVISYMQNGLFNCTWTKDNEVVKNESTMVLSDMERK